MRSLILVSVIGLSTATHAALELPAIFSDHAVLQRAKTVPVWGWTEAGEEVRVAVAGKEAKATADASGNWKVDLPALEATGPQTLTITAGTETKVIKDVLIGEVWLGSGQSNMAMAVQSAKDFDAEKAAADLPTIRMFTESSAASDTPQSRGKGGWTVCHPDTVGRFSATAFFFGRELHRSLQLPVGLINSSVGGTPIESWISRDAQAASAEIKPFFEAVQAEAAKFDPVKARAVYEKQLAAWKVAAAKAKVEGKPAPRAPRDPVATRAKKGNVGGLFNGKIAPLIPYAIRGAIWYQGEANSNYPKAEFYQHQLPLLVKDWRSRWNDEFPFAWVQLPNYAGGRGDGWMLVREAALKSVQSVPNSGMAVTLDIGEAKDIHPKNKQEVGRRLSLWALNTVYGKKDLPSGSPMPVKHEVKDGAMVVTMTHADGGLILKPGKTSGFVIAGPDKKWQPAEARIAGDQVVVSSPSVPQPVAVRYAWAELPDVTLWSGAGLPATQFRTDDWSGATEAAKAR